MRRTMIAVLGAALATASGAMAQGRPIRPPRDAAARPGAQRLQEMPPAQRQEYERRIRQALARAVREKVGLDEDQMRKLAPVNRKYAQQRRAITEQERQIRVDLRREVMDTANTDQTKIADDQSRLLDLQRQRIETVQAEQKELLTFMTPLQVAKYRGLQEQLRRRVTEMQMRRQAQMQQGGTDPFGTVPDTGHEPPRG